MVYYRKKQGLGYAFYMRRLESRGQSCAVARTIDNLAKLEEKHIKSLLPLNLDIYR